MAASRSRLTAVAAWVAAALLVAGCGGGGSSRPSGISSGFQRQAVDACARAVGAVGILDFTAIPDTGRLGRVADTFDGTADRLQSASPSTAADRRAQAHLVSAFRAGADAVRAYVTTVNSSGTADARYNGMVAALGDIGSAGFDVGTNSCVFPQEA